MDAKDNGTDNPFADTSQTLEWIVSAMEAARRHKERLQDPLCAVDPSDERRPAPGDIG